MIAHIYNWQICVTQWFYLYCLCMQMLCTKKSLFLSKVSGSFKRILSHFLCSLACKICSLNSKQNKNSLKALYIRKQLHKKKKKEKKRVQILSGVHFWFNTEHFMQAVTWPPSGEGKGQRKFAVHLLETHFHNVNRSAHRHAESILVTYMPYMLMYVSYLTCKQSYYCMCQCKKREIMLVHMIYLFFLATCSSDTCLHFTSLNLLPAMSILQA